ncbi:MAG: 2-succinyl-5-enolpyruvyl-6-hydroxy-3-cyclohexene-1-carboxylic-acid synthase [Cyanobacteria bacterium P01_G01_bin.54]
MPLDFRNTNTLCTSVFVQTLAQIGLKLAVLCPGYRCTPLTVAFAAHPDIEAIAILDERSAAFFALGQAKQTGAPVVLVCTSGTAGANFYPAIIEAHHAQVPLLVLTGDRPPELHHCHAGQTIDQLKLYGHYPNWQAELALPEATLSAASYWRQMALQAWRRCHLPHRGVVHLNCPFRKPLEPIAPPPLTQAKLADLQAQIDPQTFFAPCQPLQVPRAAPLTLPTLPTTRGLIIAGLAQPDDPAAYGQAVAQLAEQTQYPVLAAGLSPLRNWTALNPALVTQYERILRDRTLPNQLTPQLVIQLGELPTSKVLQQWLAAHQVPRWIIAPQPENFDPLHGPSQLFMGAIEQGVQFETDPIHPQEPGDKSYLIQWQTLERRLSQDLARELTAMGDRFEGKVAWLLSRHLPPETPVMVANSMPVRDVAYFWQGGDRYLRLYFNRGANGIDGTLSTALGLAHHNQPTVLLTGDLALLHDTNGLLSCGKLHGHLTIIVINNQGGGIFEMLPIAQFEPPFTEFVALPQAVTLQPLCAAYGVEYCRIETWEQLIELLSSLPQAGVRLLEVGCDRRADQARRRRLLG